MKTKKPLHHQVLLNLRRFPALTVSALAAFASVNSLNAQSVIVAWDAKPANTTLSSSTASTIDANLSGPVTLTLGSGFTPNSVGNTFGGYSTVDTSSGLASADLNGTYWQFTLAPASGYQVEIYSLVVPQTTENVGNLHGLFSWQGSPACTINLASAADSYGSSLGSATVISSAADAGYYTLNLTTPLTISSAETFRIEFSENFGWRTIGLQPDNYWDPSLQQNAMVINGAVTSVTPVPEPGSCALLLVGLGLFPLIRRRQV